LRVDFRCVTLPRRFGGISLVLSNREEYMRRYGLSLLGAVALSGPSYSAATATPLMCAVGTAVHNHARITLSGKTLATCSGSIGCKCVSCYDLKGAAYSSCYPLYVIGIPK